jgi:predicted SAM-dependent methyltransferase
MRLSHRLRAAGRSALRPAWLIVWRRIEARIRAMPNAPLSEDSAWQQHMPAFLNAVSTVGAFGHELARARRQAEAQHAETTARLAALESRAASLDAMRHEVDTVAATLAATEIRLATAEGRHDAAIHSINELRRNLDEIAARVEFIRREILYELRYAPSSGATAAPRTLEPRILSREKLACLRHSGLRVNLGCGHIPLPGYINVDMRALPGVDIVAEAGNLPLEPGTLRELRSAHLLEHFPQEELRRRLLPYWFSLLAPGGRFTAIVPDGEAMVGQLAAGAYRFDQFREVLFGAQDYAGDFHFNLFEPASIHALLHEAGFTDIDIPVRARRNGACYELEVHATRP